MDEFPYYEWSRQQGAYGHNMRYRICLTPCWCVWEWCDKTRTFECTCNLNPKPTLYWVQCAGDTDARKPTLLKLFKDSRDSSKVNSNKCGGGLRSDTCLEKGWGRQRVATSQSNSDATCLLLWQFKVWGHEDSDGSMDHRQQSRVSTILLLHNMQTHMKVLNGKFCSQWLMCDMCTWCCISGVSFIASSKSGRHFFTIIQKYCNRTMFCHRFGFRIF